MNCIVLSSFLHDFRPKSLLIAAQFCLRNLLVFSVIIFISDAAALNCLDARSGSVTIDYPMVEVSPEFQLNGAPFVTNEADSVEIWLSQDGILQVLLGTTDELPQPVNVVAGLYDLVYRNPSPGDPSLPQNTFAIFEQGVDISQNGVVVVNVISVLAQGNATLDGAAFSVSPLERGDLYASGTTGQGEVFLGSTHNGTFSKMLIAGMYELVYRRGAGKTAVPANENAVIAQLDLTTSNPAIAVNISSHVASGDFLFNGLAATPSPLETGEIDLRRLSASGMEDRVYLGETRNQSYTTRAIAGSYKAYYARLQAGVVAPRNTDSIVASNVRVNGTPLNVDVNIASYAGSFEVNGNPAPASLLETGQIVFIDRETGAETTIGNTHDSSFSFKAIPGFYDLAYRHTAGGTAVPVNEFAVFSPNHEFGDGGQIVVQLVVDVPMTETQLSLQLNGQPWNPADGSATLRLINPDGSMSLLLGSSDASPWTHKLVSASYRMNYLYDNGNAVPINALTVLPQQLTINGSNDTMQFRLDTIQLTPSALINGAGFPATNNAGLILRGSEGLASYGSTAGLWPEKMILQGQYQTIYGYTTGAKIPVNLAHQRICINAELCLFCDGFEAIVP